MGECLTVGFTMRGANTDPNRPPEPPKKDTGPQLYRDPKYPTMVQNGLTEGGSSGGGSGFGGGNGPHNFDGYGKFNAQQEWTFGKVNDTPFAVKSSAGSSGYLKSEGTYEVKPSGKIKHQYGSSKTTGWADGNIHNHGTHWHGNDGQSDGIISTGEKPTTGILKNLIK